MWNLSYANRKCNEFEKQRDHIQHLERITNIKCSIDKKEPKKPTFLFQKANRANPEQINWKKTFYENTVLLKKILDIENKPSPYHPVNLKLHKCPAYQKTDFVNKQKKNEINKENAKLYKRLVSAKTHYSTDESIKNYNYTTYISTMISNTKNNIHPNVISNFDTPSTFKKKYQRHIMMNSIGNNSNSNTYNLRNSSNFQVAGNTTYEHSPSFNYTDKNLKHKNILAAIDINSNYNNNNNNFNKIRPYSANKQLNKSQNSANYQQNIDFNKPRSAKSKLKAHDNLDLGNYQDFRNVNADYYQKQIESLLKQYGNEAEIDENILRAYFENLNSGEIIIENENNEEEEEENDDNNIYNNENQGNKPDENDNDEPDKVQSGQGKNTQFFQEEIIVPDEADNFYLYNLQNNDYNNDIKEDENRANQEQFIGDDDIEIDNQIDEQYQENIENE